MNRKPTPSDDPALRAVGRSEPEAKLRRRAEARLRGRQSDPKSDAGTQRLLHELEVHRIELEMPIPCLSAWICARLINRDERP